MVLVTKGVNINTKWGEFDNPPLNEAVVKGHVNMVKFLLKQERKAIHHKNVHGWTPLHTAAVYGHFEIAKILPAKKAGIDTKNNDGDTPLKLAEKNGHTKVVKLLLKHGGR